MDQENNTTIEHLLHTQNKYLEEIHSELLRRKQEEERTRIFRWVGIIIKYGVIIGAVFYFGFTIQNTIQNMRDSVPKLPEVSLPSFK